MHEELHVWIGEWIRRMRQAAGMTQLDLARKIGTTQQWVSHLETGRRIPSLLGFVAICRALAGDRPLGEMFRQLTE